MPVVVVFDPSNVTIDGQHAGSVPDVLSNHGLHQEVLAALHDCHAGLRCRNDEALQSLRDDHAAATKVRDDAHAAELAGLKATHAAALGARGDELAKAVAQVADLQSQVDALGGTELGKKMRRAAERARLAAAAEKAAAALAAHDEAPAP